MAKVLTDAAVKNLKCDPRKRREVPDGHVPGLHIVIQPSDKKSWAFRYRLGGKPQKLTLGSLYVPEEGEKEELEPMLGGALTLAGARQLARTASNDLARGADPAERKRALRRVGLPNPARDLVKNVVAEFLAKHFKDKRSTWEVERMFRHDVLPYWGERRIQDISKRDVIELLDRLTDRGVGSMTNRVFSVVRKLFNWACARDILSVSPCAGIKPPVPETSRDRVLTDDEIRWFWHACDGAGYPFGPLFKLLLLTGQRLSEVADMTASELKLKDRLWTIPKERAKNNVAHDVALSNAALAILERMPRIRSKAGYLFTTTRETAVSGFSRAKNNIDKAMIEIARKEAEEVSEGPDDVNVPAWRLHDLRRSCASGMARLGINLPVIEKVLNHTSGSFAGIVGVYQRHSFADEKRAALETWGNFVERLVAEKPASNIVELRA